MMMPLPVLLMEQRCEELCGMSNNATQPVEPNQPNYVACDPNFFDQSVILFDGVN